MKGQSFGLDYIVSSPAQRARETVCLVCAELGLPDKMIHWDERIYSAGVGTLLQVLVDVPEAAQRAMLVGHNPGLEELLIYLCGPELPRRAGGKLLPTGTLAWVELAPNWAEISEGCGELLGLRRPKELKD
jgi:phosphohistidine phosphatase